MFILLNGNDTSAFHQLKAKCEVHPKTKQAVSEAIASFSKVLH